MEENKERSTWKRWEGRREALHMAPAPALGGGQLWPMGLNTEKREGIDRGELRSNFKILR